PTSNKRSPVWRLAVLWDPFSGRLTNRVIDPTSPTAAADAAKQILSTDPDGYGIEMDEHADRYVYFTTNGDTNRENDNAAASDVPTTPAEYHLVPTPVTVPPTPPLY